ncbi:MAG: hypothetical protein C5B58_07180 [Acidobacteria bacterium]|nr:MAG: hypothetical protein C5B58_07180 [Acidobacteriota bacterium]
MPIVFAYGSNMLTAKMTCRARSAVCLGRACLQQFALRWNKKSTKDGSGKCSIDETRRPEDLVWGVLFEMTAEDKKALDKFEGLGRGYGERQVTVSANGKPSCAYVYYATSIDPHIRPYDWYKEQVVAGARQHGVPAEYIRQLEATPAVPDPNPDRAARERSLLDPQVSEI